MRRKLLISILASIAGGLAFIALAGGGLWLFGEPLTFDQMLAAGGIYTGLWIVVLVLDAFTARFGFLR